MTSRSCGRRSFRRCVRQSFLIPFSRLLERSERLERFAIYPAGSVAQSLDRPIFLSDLSGVLCGQFGYRPRDSVDASLHPLDLACLGYLKEQDISINCDGHHGTIPLVSHYWAVDGEIPKHLCPSCGRQMGLTRTVPAAPGYSELRTYGCRECGVWLTEGSTSRDQRHDTFVSLK